MRFFCIFLLLFTFPLNLHADSKERLFSSMATRYFARSMITNRISKMVINSSEEDRDFEIKGKKGYVSNNEQYLETDLRLRENIKFSFAKSDIPASAYDLLKQYGNAMENGASDSVLLIEGHTDSIGTYEDNYKLSLERASSVKRFFSRFFDVDPSRIIVRAYGERKPIATNMYKDGRAKNRRVEFVRLQSVEFTSN